MGFEKEQRVSFASAGSHDELMVVNPRTTSSVDGPAWQSQNNYLSRISGNSEQLHDIQGNLEGGC